MVSKFALLSNLLLTSAALATSRLGDRLARRRENRYSHPIDHVVPPAAASSDAEYTSNWAGAVWVKDNGTFTTVTGTFTVPTPSGNDGSAAGWVGIDGNTCQNIFQTGVDFTITGGSVSYDAWLEWYPDASYDYTGIDIHAGDVISLTVTAYSTNHGIAAIENQTTGQNVTQEVGSRWALCQENAEWIVEDFEDGDGNLVPFADFGTVTFTDATATGPSGITYTPSGASIVNIMQNGTVLTSVSINGEDVTVSYV